MSNWNWSKPLEMDNLPMFARLWQKWFISITIVWFFFFLLGGVCWFIGMFNLRSVPDGPMMTRLATIPLLINIAVAIITTKIPMLMQDGVWKMLHEARTDFTMVLGLVFLLIVGAGGWSVDAALTTAPPRSSP